MMRELSIFIDESGDFGPYDHRAPFYLITLVLHDQSVDISRQVIHLKQHVIDSGIPPNQALHAGPLIRREQQFSTLELPTRKKLFHSLFTFVRLCDVQYKTFVFSKREFSDHAALVSRIAREIGLFVREHLLFFQSYERLVVYYDNGQKEIATIVNAVFNAHLGAEVRKVIPSDYCLFQAADLICTLELLNTKIVSGMEPSTSEKVFFESKRELTRRYLKPLARKKMS